MFKFVGDELLEATNPLFVVVEAVDDFQVLTTVFHEFFPNADVQFLERFQTVCEERRGDDGEFLHPFLDQGFDHLRG